MKTMLSSRRFTLKQTQIVNWGGVALAEALGLGGHYWLGIPYPIEWLLWAPGWSMMVLSIFLGTRKRKEVKMLIEKGESGE